MNTGPIEAFAELKSALTGLRETLDDGLWQCHEADVVGLIRRNHRVVAQLHFLGLDLLTEAQQRSVPDRQAATSPANWLSGLLRLSPGAAKEQVRVAESLAHRNRDTAAALAEGEVGFEQAAAITRTVDALPAAATHDQRRAAETFLLEQSRILDAAQLMGCRKRLNDVIDPDGTLEREKTAAQLRGASFRNHGDGTQTFSCRDTDERMAKLKAALDPLAAPRPETNAEKDDRTPAQRRADAMADLVSLALRGDQLPKQRGNGVPLAVGRTRRTVTPAQWCALVIRDGGCIFPGCDRPAGWCQAHHVIWWEDWGVTDLDNLVLPCDHRHDSVHHHGGDVTLAPAGHPQVIPPAWRDQSRTPRRNSYWRPPPLDRLL
jgi:hypothetical protein